MAMCFLLSVLLFARIRDVTWGPKSRMAEYIWIMFLSPKMKNLIEMKLLATHAHSL